MKLPKAPKVKIGANREIGKGSIVEIGGCEYITERPMTLKVVDGQIEVVPLRRDSSAR